MSASSTTVLLAVVLGFGCTGPEPGSRSWQLPSIAVFEAEVQPATLSRCGSGGCHGRAERPLALWVPGTLRRDPARTYLDEPLDDDETRENAARLVAFADLSPRATSLLVCKPLSPEEGGCSHGGGTVFVDRSDSLCRAMERWLDLEPTDELVAETRRDGSEREPLGLVAFTGSRPIRSSR